MRVCIVGSGISGLAAATYLSQYHGMDVSILERDAMFGGRANSVDGAEHCQRLFMDDYTSFFDILRGVPAPDSFGSIFDSLEPVARKVRVGGEWRRISHIYAFWSRELKIREKFRVVRDRQTSVLLANRIEARKKLRRMLGNYTLLDFAALLATSKRSPSVRCLPGPTLACLIEPWVVELRARGVELFEGRGVQSLEHVDRAGWEVATNAGRQFYDAVILTGVPHDLAELLDGSGVVHRIPADREQLHFKVLTLDVLSDDPHWGVGDRNVLLPHNGVTVFLQRPIGRAIAFCSSPINASTEYVIMRAQDILGPRVRIRLRGVRENDRPSESIYASSQLEPSRVLPSAPGGLFLAGSAMRSTYRVDSGEAAVRSARRAVDALLEWSSRGRFEP